jgi:hypothetical protein
MDVAVYRMYDIKDIWHIWERLKEYILFRKPEGKRNDRWKGIIKGIEYDNGDLTSGSGEGLVAGRLSWTQFISIKDGEFLV